MTSTPLGQTHLRFHDKTALVTGGGQGIGRAISRDLLRGGSNIVITGRREPPLQEAAQHLARIAAGLGNENAPRIHIFVADAADQSAVNEVIAATIDRFGSLDLLVNNVGLSSPSGTLMELDPQDAARILAVNVTAPLLYVQAAWKAWMQSHGGSIVNIGSTSSLAAAGVLGWYGVSKAALANLTLQLSSQLAPTVRVNSVAPSIVRTDFSRELYQNREEAVAATFPLGRFGTPEDVASAVCWLLSDEASWITGETLVIDGGRTRGRV